MDGIIDEGMDGWMDSKQDGWMDGWMVEKLNKRSFSVSEKSKKCWKVHLEFENSYVVGRFLSPADPTTPSTISTFCLFESFSTIS